MAKYPPGTQCPWCAFQRDSAPCLARGCPDLMVPKMPAPGTAPVCPECKEVQEDGECDPCALFLCDWCAHWRSAEDGASGDSVDDVICSGCWCRRNNVVFPEGTAVVKSYGEDACGRL